jgi:(p)ppGpp synthase/HD superfamily hydrolase
MIRKLFSQALAVAIEAHAGQQRKGTTIMYISHPMGVAQMVAIAAL